MFDHHVQSRLARGKDMIKSTFWSHSNITSVGVGARKRNGEWTDEPAVTVGVVKKRRPGYLRADEILPERIDIDGVSHRVDVEQVGRVTMCAQQEFPGLGQDPKSTWMLTGRDRPLRPADKISNNTTLLQYPDGSSTWESGTLSCFVKDAAGVVYMMSNSHVLVNHGILHNPVDPKPVIGEKISQPNPATSDENLNVVAELSNYVDFKHGPFASNTMDGAIARLYDQSGWENRYPGDRMSPLSSANKAIGLYFASNDDHSRGWIVRIEPMLRQFGVSMMVPDSTTDVTGYQMFDPIEKVGARTGYSSTQIVNVMDSTKVHISASNLSYSFDNLIATERMGWGGDSGSLVRLGGDGITQVILENVPNSSCGTFDSVGTMYGLPVNNDIPLADNIRDNFLAQTRLGSLLTHLFYLNAETVTTRSQASPTSASEKAGARSLYDKYRNFVETVMVNPRDPSYVVTQEHLDDTALAISGGELHMYQAETDALNSIYTNVIKRTLGMRYDDLIGFMNDDNVYHSVLDTLRNVSTIVTEGVVGEG
jgi:hypothetical protein